MPMSKPLDFAALRRWFEVVRMLSLIAGGVACVTAIGLAYYLRILP